MQASEHIFLESDEREVPDLHLARKIHARLRLRSRLRRRSIELTLIDFQFLSVRTWRAQRLASRYVLDLRYVDPAPLYSRHVAWRWITASVVLSLLAVAVGWRISMAATAWWQHDGLVAVAALCGFAVAAAAVSIYRTTETLCLWSLNGRARLLGFTGGLGTIRAARSFSAQLAAHLRFAETRRRSSRAAHLRDEMREHFRLKAAGLLSDDEYEASKARILRRHR